MRGSQKNSPRAARGGFAMRNSAAGRHRREPQIPPELGISKRLRGVLLLPRRRSRTVWQGWRLLAFTALACGLSTVP